MISDLLASITGEKPTTSPTTSTRPSPGIPKRKADDELRGATAKAPRTESSANGSARPNGNSSRPLSKPTDRPLMTASTSATSTSTVRTSTSAVPTSSAAPSRSASRPVSTSTSKPLPTRPVANRPVASDGAPAPPPKKRSFAEVMARARANTSVRESFGKIQHKPIEKGLTMKERKEMKADEARQLKKGARPQMQSRNGVPKPTPRTAASTASQRGGPLRTAPTKGKSAPTPVVEEKKVKKAALATTGYTGTARPRPGAKPTKPGAGALADAERPHERPRYGGALAAPRRYNKDDYDEELDDFIEYDDEEDEYGGRPKPGYYDEEDESDMEAGLTDIDEEERRAEALARKEDLEEELREQQLKKEKERRKQLVAKGYGR